MYGDAICVPAAAEFIHACREAKREYRELRG
jgi:hypothetical protein